VINYADRTMANNAQLRGIVHVGVTVPDLEAARVFEKEGRSASLAE
jgi:hypothetical protein